MRPRPRDLFTAAAILAALYLLMLAACVIAATLYPATPAA